MKLPAQPWIVGLGLLLGLSACGARDPAGPAAPRGVPAAGQTGETRAAPGAGASPWILEWQRWRDPRERIQIGRGGAAMGPAGGPLRRLLFTEPERTWDILAFSRTYASFRIQGPGGLLEFRGRGPIRPGAAERRMILEWARLVAAEASGLAPGSGYGLVFASQRGGAVCEEVAVYLSGEVRAGPCGGDNPIAGRLAAEPLARVYGWFERLRPFQAGAAGEGSVETSRLVFTGKGSGEPTGRDRGAVAELVAALHRELAVTSGRAPAAPAAAGQGGLPNAKKRGRSAPPEPSPSGPAGPRLLLPPSRALRLPEVVIPEHRIPKPPPVPKEERQTLAPSRSRVAGEGAALPS